MTDQDLRVTLVQSDIIWEDAERNRRRMAEHIAKAEASDIIILPEMFTTGFSMAPRGLRKPCRGLASRGCRSAPFIPAARWWAA